MFVTPILLNDNTQSLYTPISMRAGNPQDTSAEACAISHSLWSNDSRFHDGVGQYPALGDTVYTGQTVGSPVLNGFDHYYLYQDGSPGDASMQINNLGVIIDIISC